MILHRYEEFKPVRMIWTWLAIILLADPHGCVGDGDAHGGARGGAPLGLRRPAGHAGDLSLFDFAAAGGLARAAADRSAR